VNDLNLVSYCYHEAKRTGHAMVLQQMLSFESEYILGRQPAHVTCLIAATSRDDHTALDLFLHVVLFSSPWQFVLGIWHAAMALPNMVHCGTGSPAQHVCRWPPRAIAGITLDLVSWYSDEGTSSAINWS
jgi:hypothetical protein